MTSSSQSLWNLAEAADAALAPDVGDRDVERIARSLKAISHPLRLRLLCALRSEERTAQAIIEQLGDSQSNVSKHLVILREKGILASRRDGSHVYYRVRERRILSLLCVMRDLFCPQH